MSDLLIGRKFQLWEYRVSLGSLLFRSPADSRNKLPNIDIIFRATAYVRSPGNLGEVQLAQPTDDEIAHVQDFLGWRYSTRENVCTQVLKGDTHRTLVHAFPMYVKSHFEDIFWSPFDFDYIKRPK
jgi:hypothetical protein